MEIVICEQCEKELNSFDLRMQPMLKGICLECGKSGDWEGMNPNDRSRCAELHRWANMTAEQRNAYDRNRGA